VNGFSGGVNRRRGRCSRDRLFGREEHQQRYAQGGELQNDQSG
jgi:hypothetical protein